MTMTDGSRPRIHWFSPLAPARTDIAHYTGRILPALAARAEVTLWTDQPGWYPGLEQHAAVRRFHDGHFAWDPLNDADAVFYNIGNDARFHRAIAGVSRRFPGFSILHDVLLHDSVSFDCRERGDRAQYLEIMRAHYGERGLRDGELHWEGALSLLQMGRIYSCVPFFLASSLGAIVHSQAAERALAKEVEVPVIRLPLPFAARRRPPRPRDLTPPWKLVVFGYLGANRCLEQVLEALGQVAGLPFELHIYGEVQHPGRLRQAGERVTVHGFVPEAELDAALAAAHLAINLRYPTKGEASGSQLRIWSHGLASLVTRVGWYAELPAGTAAFVRPECLVEDLCAHLRSFAARPAEYAAAGLAGYEYFLERHLPAGYAARLVEIARQATAYRQRWNAVRMSDRMVEGLDGWFPAGRLDGYLEHVAEVVGELS